MDEEASAHPPADSEGEIKPLSSLPARSQTWDTTSASTSIPTLGKPLTRGVTISFTPGTRETSRSSSYTQTQRADDMTEEEATAAVMTLQHDVDRLTLDPQQLSETAFGDSARVLERSLVRREETASAEGAKKSNESITGLPTAELSNLLKRYLALTAEDGNRNPNTQLFDAESASNVAAIMEYKLAWREELERVNEMLRTIAFKEKQGLHMDVKLIAEAKRRRTALSRCISAVPGKLQNVLPLE